MSLNIYVFQCLYLLVFINCFGSFFAAQVMHVSALGFSKEESFYVLECEPFEMASILEITISSCFEYTVNACTRIITDADWK